jgi:hypothetical protein
VLHPDKLHELATWYRELAERAGSPWIWEARLRMAEDLEAEAGRMIQSVPGEWHPRIPERLDEEELADWGAGRNAVYPQLTIGGPRRRRRISRA